MSTLTQFLPQGDSFPGDFTLAYSANWGANPTFGDKEFLQTGYTKTYSSAYATLAANARTAILNSEDTTFSTAWTGITSGNFPNRRFMVGPTTIYTTGGYLHIANNYYCDSSTNGNLINVGLDTTAGYTSATLTSTGPAVGPGQINVAGVYCYGSTYFKSYVIVSAGGASGGVSTGDIWSSNGSTYTSRVNFAPAKTFLFSASPSICVGLTPGANQTTAGNAYTTTNGTTFTSTNANTNFEAQSSIYQFCYSKAGNVFIVVTGNGKIYTADGGDGLTYTERTTPANFPKASEGAYQIGGSWSQTNWFGTTATETLISVGQTNANATYLLKTTDGTSFTLVDLVANAPQLVGLVVGFNQISVTLQYANSKYWICAGANVAYSSDGGVTWTLDYSKYRSGFATGSLAAGSSYFKFSWGGANEGACTNKMYGEIRNGVINSGYVPYSTGESNLGNGARFVYMNERYALSTPQLVGATATVTVASGSNLSTYLRIK